MRITFCDLCNESVPQADLDEGTAVLRKGRVVCARCEAAMTSERRVEGASRDAGRPVPRNVPAPRPVVEAAGHPAAAGDTTVVGPVPLVPASRPSSSGVAVGVALASVALIAAVGGTAFLHDQFETRQRDLARDLERVEHRAGERGERLLARLDAELRALDAKAAESRGELTQLKSRLDELAGYRREELDTMRDDLVRLIEKASELDGLMAAVERHDQELAKVAATAANLRTQVSEVGDRLVTVEEDGQREFPPAPLPVEDDVPEWVSLVSDLGSPNSGTRWQAVQSLGATGDPAVTEHLTPLLKDSDIFVRMATARVLGDLGAVVGIPALIDALEDPEASVREAVVVSLRSITGRDFKFDPGGREADRAKRVKAWRDWWKKAAPDVLPGDL